MGAAITVLAIFLSFNCCSCTPADDAIKEAGNGNGSGSQNYTDMTMQITIGSAVYIADMEDNAAAEAFMRLLPLTLSMGDVNSNEKYARLGTGLPTSPSNPGTIRTGDLMLWGTDGLVLFYKTFQTSYTYTRLGTIRDVTGIQAALGTGSATVRFELLEGEI